MGQDLMMYSELGFNLLYLGIIWWLVFRMFRKKRSISVPDQQISRYFLWAFFLLALGDTGHVGFRLVAYALGGLESTIDIPGYNLPLVGAGALSTAITMTIFYMFMIAAWKVRFKEKAYGPYLSFQLLLVARLVLMCFPQNEWANVVPPAEWSLYRNLPLTIAGLGLVSHIFLSNRKVKDRFFHWMAVLILASFLFYLPVVLWIQQIPMLGMLMIPKTIAYVWLGFLAYGKYFRPSDS